MPGRIATPLSVVGRVALLNREGHKAERAAERLEPECARHVTSHAPREAPGQPADGAFRARAVVGNRARGAGQNHDRDQLYRLPRRPPRSAGVERRLAEPYRSDGDHVRLIAFGPTFPTLLTEAFDQIRRSAPGNVRVAVRLLQVLADLKARTGRAANLLAIATHARLIAEAVELHATAYHDREQVRRALDAIGPAPSVERT